MSTAVGSKKIWLATPTMHGDELKYMTEAYETNWMSTVGANINEVERIAAEKPRRSMRLRCLAAPQRCIWRSSTPVRRCTARAPSATARWRASGCFAPI